MAAVAVTPKNVQGVGDRKKGANCEREHENDSALAVLVAVLLGGLVCNMRFKVGLLEVGQLLRTLSNISPIVQALPVDSLW